MSSGGSRISHWGAPNCWGVPTSDTGAFQWKRMQKWKNWILLEGRASDTPQIRQWSASCLAVTWSDYPQYSLWTIDHMGQRWVKLQMSTCYSAIRLCSMLGLKSRICQLAGVEADNHLGHDHNLCFRTVRSMETLTTGTSTWLHLFNGLFSKCRKWVN